MDKSLPKQKPARGLGRGLSALFEDDEPVRENTQTPAASAKERTLGIDQLQPGRFQPRQTFDDASLSQLTDSIEKHGIIQPLVVRLLSPNAYEIIAGERRWRAAQKAGLHEVPVVIKELDDLQALEIALIENLQRVDLDPIEEAEGFKRLINEFNYTQDILAAQLGKSRPHIANMMRLLGLPKDVQDLVRTGKLSTGHARALIGLSHASQLAQEIIEKNLSVRDIEQRASEEKQTSRKSDKAPAPKDPDIAHLESMLSNMIGMKAQIKSKKGQKGEIVLRYDSLDVLDRFLNLLNGHGQQD